MYTENQYEEFVKRIEETYPKMFKEAYGGIAVGSGWWPIIERLCNNIQNYIDWQVKNNKDCSQVVVEQIKEKFGGLRFYYQGGDEYINGLVTMAESWAAHSCETCGAPGERRSGGWIRTLCDHHEAEHQAMKKRADEEYAKKNGLEL